MGVPEGDESRKLAEMGCYPGRVITNIDRRGDKVIVHFQGDIKMAISYVLFTLVKLERR